MKAEIEHVLPQKLTPEWERSFSKSQHRELVNCFANLLPVERGMNSHLGQKSFDEKKEVVTRDSMYKASREFYEQHNEWNPEAMKKRGQELADWAVEYWPLP
ncbi:MAG: HNH endonuclease family protein [Parvibaculales bacterium]